MPTVAACGPTMMRSRPRSRFEITKRSRQQIGPTLRLVRDHWPVSSSGRHRSVERLRLIAQHVFLHLAGRGLGQGTEHDRARRLEMRQVLAAESNDLLRRGARARLERHEGAWRLAPFIVVKGG